MSQPANDTGEARALSGVVGGAFLGVAGGALNSFVDDALVVPTAPNAIAWFRFLLRGTLVLFAGVPGIFLVAAAWPSPGVRAMKIAGVLAILVVALVSGAWFVAR